jgi:hypothetical protein
MPTLLHIDSSADLTHSRSRALTAAFADAWRARGPEYTVVRRDLHVDQLPHLESSALHWAAADRTAEETVAPEAEALRQQVIDELLIAHAAYLPQFADKIAELKAAGVTIKDPVVADLVALSHYPFVDFRILTHIVAHHEEGGLHLECLQGVEDERCRLRDGTVVEGQIDGLLVTVHPPKGSRVEPTEVDGGLFDKHITARIFRP